jgi:hypothetical protein
LFSSRYLNNLGGSASIQIGVLAAIYVLIIGFIFQFIVLPLIPSIHSGHGLLLGADGFGFHKGAVVLANSIEEFGLSVFRLRPDGQAPVGIAAFIYWVVGVHEPWVLLPLNAFLFGVCIFSLHYILLSIMPHRFATISVIPMVIAPSGILIYGQIHKDIFSMTGIFLLMLVISVLSKSSFKLPVAKFFALLAITFIAGFLVWLVRPYLLKVIFLCLFIAFIFLSSVAISFFKKNDNLTWGKTAVFIVQLTLLCIAFISWDYHKVESRKGVAIFETEDNTKRALNAKSENNGIVVKVIHRISDTRRGFSKYIANSNIDSHVRFDSLGDLIEYLPRALQIGFFAPFPNMWFDEASSPGGQWKRWVSAGEMLYAYIALPGVFFLILLSTKDSKVTVLACLFLASGILLIYALTVLNVGTLYRMRFGVFHLIASFGLGGWCLLLCRYSYQRKSI